MSRALDAVERACAARLAEIWGATPAEVEAALVTMFEAFQRRQREVAVFRRPAVGTAVRILPCSQLFPGEAAVVAYVGDAGISVYLLDSDKFDDCVPLDDGEYGPMESP